MVNLPSPDNRTVVIGSTSSGKTQFAVWLLSTRNFDVKPWIILDFKKDKLLAKLGATEWSLRKKPPKQPGLYLIQPLPGDDMLVSLFMRNCWAQEDIGIYIDEGYMMPKFAPNFHRWFRACLTQGRSKKIEMIILSQRPVWMDKFVFTEASFFALFKLNSMEDRKYVSNFLDGTKYKVLPKYHCLWYDVDNQVTSVFKPVPMAQGLLSIFYTRLSRKAVKI